MTILKRLTLWWCGILLVSLIVMAGVLHFEWTEQQQRFRDKKEPEPAWKEVGEIILFYGVSSALLLLGGGWVLLRKSLLPIVTLTQAAERIQLSTLQERLPSPGTGDELDRLTQVFNGMVARLEQSFSRIREFTLNASHELKTPLTVMRGELETALRGESISPGHRELFVSQLDEIERLTKIVDALTLLAKADSGMLKLKFEAIRLDDLVKETASDAQVLAEPNQIAVHIEACDEAIIRGDRHRLRQLLLNIADNAVKYNNRGGSVTMGLHRSGEWVQLRVANTGPGIPPAMLSRVFDRFFRCEISHNNAIEGCGLGLSIAQWIVKAHEGDIRITSDPNKFTQVIISLPAQESAPETPG